eukprot:TRINITY_DN63_c0_g1_i1.p1 TRINITY_DN63_c0_g1~~TRINITY_DN63_c0_g1_i1.p1  ORF type:complete len:341 (+),score=57.75 TRINITY_DN63_c0_g1_i1:81-1103(+)
MATLPVIDISPLISFHKAKNTEPQKPPSPQVVSVAAQINSACRTWGFFYITGHGVSEELQKNLETLSATFFSQDLEKKNQIKMSLGGKAWRGFFPVGNELTSGKPDLKEGLYLGSELESDHPMVQRGIPLHGKNQFPQIPFFKETILEYLKSMENLAHALMSGISLSLGLPSTFFFDRYTWEPLQLFRIFNYPPQKNKSIESWGVGEHTDYGILTILKQDSVGGLQVKSKEGWIDAPPLEGTFVCNIGDMLDCMTRGLYRSTPHRVKNGSDNPRLSFPYFFDPNWYAEVKPIENLEVVDFYDDRDERWDKASVRTFVGTYGEYVLEKVSKVFPELVNEVI